ncbi:MAG: cell wall hydrolase [Parvibaculum sp.]
MRRLLEWLDVSHIVSGTAHVAVGLFCLTVVGGAIASSVIKHQDMAPVELASAHDAAKGHVVSIEVPLGAVRQASTRAAANDAVDAASSMLVPAVFTGADASSLLVRNNRDEDDGDPLQIDHPVLTIALNDLERQRLCLTQGIYYEARGERPVGRLAVAEVILNRVASNRYPATICGVVFQGAKSHRCQFSFACMEKVMNRPRNSVAWRKAQRLAHYVLSGRVDTSVIGSATYYHATYVSPYWAPSMVEVAKIGRHIFYRSAADGLANAPQS